MNLCLFLGYIVTSVTFIKKMFDTCVIFPKMCNMQVPWWQHCSVCLSEQQKTTLLYNRVSNAK